MYKLLFISVCTALLFGCKTTRYIDREKIVIDSSLVQQNEGLQQTLIETIERYEKEREAWLTTGVLFDTVYKDTGRVVNKVTFDNGRIKTIEGRIFAVNQDLHEKTAELLDAHATIDDLSMKLERTEAELSKKVTTVTRDVEKTYLPWWLYIILFVAGWIARGLLWPKILNWIRVKLPFFK